MTTTPERRRAPRRDIDGVEHQLAYAIVDIATGKWDLFSGAFTRDEMTEILAVRKPTIMRSLWLSMDILDTRVPPPPLIHSPEDSQEGS